MIWKYICLPSNYHISPQKSIYYIYSLDGNVGNILLIPITKYLNFFCFLFFVFVISSILHQPYKKCILYIAMIPTI